MWKQQAMGNWSYPENNTAQSDQDFLFQAMDAMLRAAGSVVVLVGVVGAEAVVCRL
jgi:hypothetical protein